MRETARALVFDAENRLLLVRWRDPVDGHEVWEPPGGGTEKGESLEETARRETLEETGIAINVGECVAEVEVRFRWAGRDFHTKEKLFVSKAVTHEAVPTMRDEVEVAGFVEMKWWRVEELRTLENFDPRHLVAIHQAIEAR